MILTIQLDAVIGNILQILFLLNLDRCANSIREY